MAQDVLALDSPDGRRHGDGRCRGAAECLGDGPRRHRRRGRGADKGLWRHAENVRVRAPSDRSDVEVQVGQGVQELGSNRRADEGAELGEDLRQIKVAERQLALGGCQRDEAVVRDCAARSVRRAVLVRVGELVQETKRLRARHDLEHTGEQVDDAIEWRRVLPLHGVTRELRRRTREASEQLPQELRAEQRAAQQAAIGTRVEERARGEAASGRQRRGRERGGCGGDDNGAVQAASATIERRVTVPVRGCVLEKLLGT